MAREAEESRLIRILMEETMKVLTGLLTVIAVVALVATPAAARKKDHANTSYCKSGVQVKDMAKCKENGGKK